MRHNIYVDYEVDGKEYKNVKARTNYSNECSDRVGDIIKIVVNPNSPGKLMFEGGILGVIGLLVLIFGIITKISKKRAK